MSRKSLIISYGTPLAGLAVLALGSIWLFIGITGNSSLLAKIAICFVGSLFLIIGFCLATTFIWSYIDYKNCLIVQKCRQVIGKPEKNEQWSVSLESITNIQLICDEDRRHPIYQIVLHGCKDKYTLDEIQSKRKARKVIQLIQIAVEQKNLTQLLVSEIQK